MLLLLSAVAVVYGVAGLAVPKKERSLGVSSLSNRPDNPLVRKRS